MTFDAAADAPFTCFVGVTGPDSTLAIQGEAEQVLPLASVSKPLTAWGVLVALERHLVELDEPAGPAGATVSHLLDHTSGLPMEGDEPERAPGERRIYSNAGFDQLAAHVADAVGMDFPEWLEQEVVGPLGLVRADVSGRPSAGYHASLADLLAFAREVLRPTLVSAELRDLALTVSRGGLRGIVPGYGSFSDCRWGLGFELKGDKDPHWTGASLSPETAGHFGQSGSFLFVDPTRDLGAAFLSDQNFGAGHKAIWPALTDEIVARCGAGAPR